MNPIAVLLTPPGRGAVATVRVEGLDCVATADRFFTARSGIKLAETPSDRPVVGHFHSATSPAAEEVVVCRRGGGAVEIHGHGGTASVARILGAFQESGYKILSWDEWTNQNSPSPIRAEAYRDLARAQTELTASLLLDQYHGALESELDRIEQCDDPAEKRRRLETLQDRATWGIHLARPWQVVLAGSPNVGKSSLMNRLLGYYRAITDATPGTTRDVLRASTVFGGWPVELIDTAGLREGEHPVEQLGVERALAQLQSADLVLLLLDATRPPNDEELRLLGRHEKNRSSCRPLFLPVRSKSDLVESRDAWGPFAETPLGIEAIDTSAASGEGIDRLIERIESRLFPRLPEPGAAIPWTQRQISEIEARFLDCGFRHGRIENTSR